MTDADRFTKVLAAFPIDSEALAVLCDEARELLDKSQNDQPHGKADGTLSPREWYQLRGVAWALRDLLRAVKNIEDDVDPDPDDDIPF